MTEAPVRTIRRTCPACARRFAGLVDPDCPVCDGIGVLSLGAAALANATPPAVARAVELYLEACARRARRTMPLARLREALEASVDELRTAGVLAHNLEAGHPAHRRAADQARDVDELDALRIARGRLTAIRLAGVEVTDVDRAALAPTATTTLDNARPTVGAVPVLSRAGHRSQLARAADPIHPLDNVVDLDLAHRSDAHRARVLAGATEHLAATTARKRRTRKDTAP